MREIGDKHSQVKAKCARLVELTGGRLASDAQPAPSKTNWFWEHDLSKCRVQPFGSAHLELCAISAPAGANARAFKLTFRDPSKLDIPEKHGRRDPHDGKHHLVHEIEVAAGAGEYMLYAATAAFELSDGAYVVFVPIVKGTPDDYTSVRVLLFAFDAKAQTSTLAWQSPTCDRCSDPTIQLRGRVGSSAKQVLVNYKRDGKTRTTTLAWDGRTLHP